MKTIEEIRDVLARVHFTAPSDDRKILSAAIDELAAARETIAKLTKALECVRHISSAPPRTVSDVTLVELVDETLAEAK